MILSYKHYNITYKKIYDYILLHQTGSGTGGFRNFWQFVYIVNNYGFYSIFGLFARFPVLNLRIDHSGS